MTELLSVFIPGAIVNPLNESAWGLWKHRRRVKTMREKASVVILEALRRTRTTTDAATPKHITFFRYGHNLMDGDGYQAAVKPYRDSLKDMKLIDDDRDSAGHTFIYRQAVHRGKGAPRGVLITVALSFFADVKPELPLACSTAPVGVPPVDNSGITA